VSPLAAGGLADVAPQDAFCARAPCEISIIYDQSGSKNHLTRAPAGGNVPHPTNLLNASRLPTSVGGVKTYGGFFEGNMGCAFCARARTTAHAISTRPNSQPPHAAQT